MPPSLRHLVATLPLLASTGSGAMSIGEIVVSSYLGEPLRARVALQLDEGTLPRDECIRLAGPARHHPDLANARVTLTSQSGRYFAAIATDTRVDDPMLDLSLRSEGCGPTMQKDFVILLSPKGAAPVEAADRVDTAAAGADERPPQAETALPVAQTAKKRRRPAVAATIPARPAPAARGPAPRYGLKLDYGYGAFGQLAEQIVRQRQAAQGRTARPAAPVSPARLAQSDRLTLQPPPDDFPIPAQGGQVAAAPTASAAASASETRPATSTAGTATAGTGASAAQGGAGPAGPAPSRTWFAWLFSSFNLLFLAVLLFLALAIALWLKRRTPRSRFLDKSAPGLEALLLADAGEPEPHPLMAQHLAAADTTAERPEASTVLGDNPKQESVAVQETAVKAVETIDIPTEYPPHDIPVEDISFDRHESVDHVMELAEVMLAFGRSRQAIETLSQHIRANPRQAPDPWLKLLDLYHQSNLRDEFTALSADLHKYFNVAVADWNDFATERPAGPPTLEALPHIMARLTATWGTQEGLAYLDRLLEDNRGGQRLGFSMPIVRDILLLRDVLRQICPVSALSL